MAKKIFMGPWVHLHLQKILKSGSYIYEHVEIFRHYAKASWHDSGWTVIFNTGDVLYTAHLKDIFIM